MPWTEAQVDELINNVRRDFALERMKRQYEFQFIWVPK